MKKIGYIFLESGENGRKLIDRAVKSPEIQKLYKSGTVVIMPSLKKKERDEFMKMK